jgi:MFS family permease
MSDPAIDDVGLLDLVADLPASPALPGAEKASPAMPWTVTVLATIGFLASVDRPSFATLLVPIQKDLHVGDAAMGALTGSAVTVMYAFFALPMAWLADRVNRRTVVAVAVAAWSLATVTCGFARGYVMLMLARIGVGGAEASYLPAAMSLIGDLAPPSRRGTPIGLFNAGIAIGFASGGVIAGLLNDRYGWHIAMLAVGAPGLITAAIMFLTVREPVRGAFEGEAARAAREPLLKAIRSCLAIKTFQPFAVGWLCLNVCYLGWLNWLPAFFMRVYHLSTTQMGLSMLVVVMGGMISTVIGGPLSDRFARKAPRYRLYFCGGVALIAVPLLAASTLVPTLPEAYVCLIGYTLVSGSLSSVSIATYLSMAPVHIRALVVAVMNILGLGLGGGLAPVIFGAVNDVLKHSYGDQSLRYTLLIAPAMMAMMAVMYLLASRTIDRDVTKG